MGLVYSPSESEGLVNALRSNITTGQSMIDDLNSASRHLVDAINGRTLSGAAYTAGKGLFTELVIPTISKATSTLEQLRTKLSQYEGYAGAAGGELLDEDKLNQQLELLRAQQSSMASQINFYRMQSYLYPENAEMNLMYSNFQSQLSSYMGTTADDIQKVQDKLKKLHEFNSHVNGLFSGIKEDFNTITNAVKGISRAVISSGGKWLNPIQGSFKGGEWKIESKDVYTSLQYGRSILRKWKNNPSSFARGTVFSKSGAQIEDLSIFGKSVAKNESKLGRVVSKLPSYKHGTINRDLGMMKENVTGFKSMTKVGKAFRVAGWAGTALDVGTSVSELKSKGYSNEQTTTITARRTAVDFAASATGQTVGRVAGAAVGQALIPIPGVGAAIGSVVGGIAGSVVGGWLGSLVNKKLDEGVKPKKKGWSWPW